MPCVDPLVATQGVPGTQVVLGSRVRAFDVSPGHDDSLVFRLTAGGRRLLYLPCGSCVGCQISRARSWAIRCALEEQLHLVCSFVTLTYKEKYCPPSLVREDLSLFMRYMRRKMPRDRDGKLLPLRFFGCGEYGERTERPHYHALLFGSADREAAEQAWGKGFVTMDVVTPARIAYTAGYCAKKLGFWRSKGEEVDHSTGEVYEFQPPFLQMSRRPGIGGEFRKHWRSWRKSAIWQGREVPVPRFLHESYKENASVSELAALELEKREAAMFPTIYDLEASQCIAESRVNLKSERKRL